jgi:hypothetical protein
MPRSLRTLAPNPNDQKFTPDNRTGIRMPPSNRHMRSITDRFNRSEASMTIKTKIAALAVAALAATGSTASTTTSAEAHGFHHGWGIGAGLVGAAIVGSAIAATTSYP